MRAPLFRRTLCVFATVFLIVTALLIHFGEQNGKRVAVVGALLFLFSLCIPLLRHHTPIRAMLLAVTLAATLVYGRYVLTVQPLQALEGSRGVISARITALPEENGKLYRATVLQSDSVPAGTKLCLSFATSEMAPALLDTVNAKVQFYLPAAQQQSLKGDAIFVMAYAAADTAISACNAPAYERFAHELRAKILAGVRKVLPGNEGALVAGICLGEKSALPATVQNDFRRSGLSHLLVVSGLHMTVLIGAVEMCLRRLRLRRGVQAAILLTVLWAFMLLIGFSPSVMRAGIMLHFVILSRVIRCRADTLTSLAAALVTILLLSPYAVTDVGFLLSFAATAGIVLLTPPLYEMIAAIPVCKRHPAVATFLQLFCTPLAALLFTAPITAVYFHSLAVLSPLSNLLAVWPVTLLLPLAALGCLLMFIPFGTAVANGLFLLAGLLAKWVLAVAAGISALPFSTLQISHPLTLLWLLLLPPALVYSWRLLQRRGLRRVLATAVVITVLFTGLFTLISRKTVSVRIAAQDKSLIAIFGTAGHYMAVISGSEATDYYQAAYRLTAGGVQSLDFLVITDGDREQTPYLAQMLESVPAATLLYTAENGDWTAGIAGVRREPLSGDADFTFWNTGHISRTGDWWRVTLGETRFLFSVPGAAVTDLPANWRNTHLLVMDGTVPAGVERLRAKEAVLLCEQSKIAALTTALPWGSYPIRLAARDGASAFLTAGQGDLVAADRYWL